MFESKINRGKANGYAPLGSSGKVPLDYLPPIQSTLDTGSFATTGSNTFTGVQTLSGTSGTGGQYVGLAELTIGQAPIIGQEGFGIRASGFGGVGLALTSDDIFVAGMSKDSDGSGNDGYAIINAQTYYWPFSYGPTVSIATHNSGSEFGKYWVYENNGISYIPGDVNIGYDVAIIPTTSGSLNIRDGNINVSGSIFVSGNIYANNLTGSMGGSGTSGTSGVNGANGSQGPMGSSFTWAGAWNPVAIYGDLNTVVEYSGSSYVCVFTDSNLNKVPSFETDYWSLMASSGSSTISDISILATTGSNQFKGNQSISGSIYVSSSLVVASSVVSNGSINALNSDLIIDGGDIVLSGSLNVTGSVNIDNVIKLTPVTNFPSGQAGMLVASASYGKTNLYMYDGSDWKWLVTGSIA
jgi:hypothetical protein